MSAQTAAAPAKPANAAAYLTTEEAAAIIRTDREYVSRQCANGNLIAKKLGTEWRIHPDDLDTFMRGSKKKAPPARSRKRAR